MATSNNLTTGGNGPSRTADELWFRVETSWRSTLELVGPDRFRFLNGLVTCDVRELATASGCYGYFTSLKGRILADVAVLSLPDRFRLDLPGAARAEIENHLSKYLLADRVEIESPESRHWRIEGPEAESRLAEILGELPGEPWQAVRTKGGSWLVRRGRPGPVAFDLLSVGEEDARLLDGAGCLPLGDEAYEAVRIEQGRPRWGRDFGPDTLPQEVGEEGAVSFDKGCYLGQEVVARIHYRGGVQKHLSGVELSGARAVGSEGSVGSGAKLLFEGKEVGHITSEVFSHLRSRRIGLAMLHDRVRQAGNELEVEGGGLAVVRDLPFA